MKMRVSISLLFVVVVTVTLVAGTGIVESKDEFVPVLATIRSPTSRLLKRSLCNTFGGCGTKRSIVSSEGNSERTISDEMRERRRYEADARMITEILENILEHLQSDQNYKQGKYVMYVPRQTKMAAKLVQRPSGDDEPITASNRQQNNVQANEFEELRLI